MKIANRVVGNIIGKGKTMKTKHDKDGDGVVNSKDCQPSNPFRQEDKIADLSNEFFKKPKATLPENIYPKKLPWGKI